MISDALATKPPWNAQSNQGPIGAFGDSDCFNRAEESAEVAAVHVLQQHFLQFQVTDMYIVLASRLGSQKIPWPMATDQTPKHSTASLSTQSNF